MDAFPPLFPKRDHQEPWKRAESVAPGICPGKDPLDTRCTCPDVVYATRVRIATGTTFSSFIYCGCCDLPINPPKPA